jgi:hypothetical protein
MRYLKIVSHGEVRAILCKLNMNQGYNSNWERQIHNSIVGGLGSDIWHLLIYIFIHLIWKVNLIFQVKFIYKSCNHKN